MPQPVRPSRYSERYVYDARLGGGRYRDLQTGRLVTWERVRTAGFSIAENERK